MGHSHHPLNPFGSVNIGGTLISQSANPVGYSDVCISVKRKAVTFTCFCLGKRRSILMKGMESIDAVLNSILSLGDDIQNGCDIFEGVFQGLSSKEFIDLESSLSYADFLRLKEEILALGFSGSTNANSPQFGYLTPPVLGSQKAIDARIKVSLSRLA